MQDMQYRDFHSALMPTVEKSRVIGIRVPQLRRYAKQLEAARAEAFLAILPHEYYEEYNLHAFLVERIKDYDAALWETERLLGYLDNWATCDMLNPKAFAKHPERLLGAIERWMAAEHPYTVRFGIGMLMRYYLDEQFCAEFLQRVAAVTGEDYYVRMMVAWYFATALAKQYDAALPYLTEQRLDYWTHNKALQKAIESNRISPERKAYLRTLKRPNKC